jgi:hypothetical protein
MRLGALPNGRANAPETSNTLLPHYRNAICGPSHVLILAAETNAATWITQASPQFRGSCPAKPEAGY